MHERERLCLGTRDLDHQEELIVRVILAKEGPQPSRPQSAGTVRRR